MFLGTTPSIISQFLLKEFGSVNPKRVFVPFSGNFVIEQIVSIISKDIDIQSTDISLYSRAIGFGVNDVTFDIELRPEIAEMFPYMATKSDPLEMAATAIFFCDVGPNLFKNDIPYYQNLNKDAMQNEEVYFQKIHEKLIRFKELVSNMTYYGTDACDLIPKAKEGDILFYDPPFFLGGYEKMFEGLEACYKFDNVPFTEITPAILDVQLQDIRNSGAICYYRSLNPIPEAEIPKGYREIYRYEYRREMSYCIYTNRPQEKVWVGRNVPMREEIKHYEMITKEDVITPKSQIKFLHVKANVGNHYRLLWVKKATMATAAYNFLIFIDGKLIGMVGCDSSLAFGTELLSLFSDPAVPFSNYKKLSKLILYLISTKQFLKMFNDMTMWEHTGITTRVSTNYKVSMKYRGFFELKSREPDEGNYKYKLMYHNRDNIFNTYKQGLTQWLNKFGKDVVENGEGQSK